MKISPSSPTRRYRRLRRFIKTISQLLKARLLKFWTHSWAEFVHFIFGNLSFGNLLSTILKLHSNSYSANFGQISAAQLNFARKLADLSAQKWSNDDTQMTLFRVTTGYRLLLTDILVHPIPVSFINTGFMLPLLGPWHSLLCFQSLMDR
jgi:hypothetical protein